MSDDDDSVFDALRAGAVGYLLKDVGSEQLVEAIRIAHRGESFLQPSIASRSSPSSAGCQRRPRETGGAPAFDELMTAQLLTTRELRTTKGGISIKDLCATFLQTSCLRTCLCVPD